MFLWPLASPSSPLRATAHSKLLQEPLPLEGALCQSTLPLSAAFSLAVLHGVLTGDLQLLAAVPIDCWEMGALWTLLPARVQLHSQGRGIPAASGASPALRKTGLISAPLGVSAITEQGP